MKIVRAIFEKIEILNFFLMWTTLNIKVPLVLRVGRKWKWRAGDNYKSILNIEFEQDWSFTLDATLVHK